MRRVAGDGAGISRQPGRIMRNRFVLGSGSRAAFQGRAARMGEPLCFTLHPFGACRASPSARPCLLAVCRR